MPRAFSRSTISSPRRKISTSRLSSRSPPRSFWAVLAVWTLFSAGNSADAFLLLRAGSIGLGTSLAVLAYAVYQLVYSGLSWPLGALSDRIPRTRLLAAGLVVFALVYLGFARLPGSWLVWILFPVYGAYVAAEEGRRVDLSPWFPTAS